MAEAVTRRGALRSATGLAALVVGLGTPMSSASRADGLARCFSSGTAALRVGAAYLARHPELADDTVLDGALRRRLSSVMAAVAEGQAAKARAALRLAIAEDFAHGRTAWLGGWLLAESELLLAARHYHLTSAGHG